MDRFWRGRGRSQDVEAQLRAGRPEPRADLVRQITGEIRDRRHRVGSVRLGIAVGFTAALLAPLAAFGAFGSAATSVEHAVKSVAVAVHIIAPATPKQAAAPSSPSSSARDQYKKPKTCREKADAKYNQRLHAAKHEHDLRIAHAKKERDKALAKAKTAKQRAAAEAAFKKAVSAANDDYDKAVAKAKTRHKHDLSKC
jgi:hypothetical protein